MHLPLTPIRCLYRGVDLYGHKEAIVSGDRRFTYSQFGERCERLAAGLLDLGVKPGDRVAYLSFNTNQLLEGYYGPALIELIVDAAECASDAAGTDADSQSLRRQGPHL